VGVEVKSLMGIDADASDDTAGGTATARDHLPHLTGCA
jgi:hypothetical protein